MYETLQNVIIDYTYLNSQYDKINLYCPKRVDIESF
jgi:hypothetical protein